MLMNEGLKTSIDNVLYIPVLEGLVGGGVGLWRGPSVKKQTCQNYTVHIIKQDISLN